jgi:tRNA U34 5-methylaminomethyl-2-thiouridine-forming methyltransferase MnmC
VIEAALALGPGSAGPGEPWHGAVRAALAELLERTRPRGTASLAFSASGVPFELTLDLCDAREAMAERRERARFDAVFLDPFSPRREPDLWAAEFLDRVARAMRAPSRLSTYTVSFPVRLALAQTGLAVGAGPRVGSKAEGTLACRGLQPPPLDPKTARRLERALARAAHGDGGPTGNPRARD